MPLHDYRCTSCGAVTEHFVSGRTPAVECPKCASEATLVFLVCAKPAWLSLAQGENASPEAIDKFEKMHKQKADKEKKSLENHGDYGPGYSSYNRTPAT